MKNTTKFITTSATVLAAVVATQVKADDVQTNVITPMDSYYYAEKPAEQPQVQPTDQQEDPYQPNIGGAWHQEQEALDNAKAAGVEVESTEYVQVDSEQEVIKQTQAETQRINDAVAQAQQAQANYQAQVDAHNKAVEEFNNRAPGYPSEAVEQNLVFEHNSEPQAQIAYISPFTTEVDESVVQDAARNSNVGDKDYLVNTVLDPNSEFIQGGRYVQMKKGQTVAVEYRNLQHSTFRGEPISAVRFEYTSKQSDVYAILYNDPTITIGVMNFEHPVTIDVRVVFYDSKHNRISLDNSALVNFGSLNRGAGEHYTNRFEWVRYTDGKLVPINGSTIGVNSTGLGYSKDINDESAIGAWDSPSNENFYKGAIIGQGKSSVFTFTFGNTGRVWQWFAFNSSIPVRQIPPMPVKPQPTKIKVKVFFTVPTTPAPETDKPSVPVNPAPNSDKPVAKVEVTFNTSKEHQQTPEHSYQTPEAAKQSALPHTGDDSSDAIYILGAGFILVAAAIVRKNKKGK